MSDKEPDDALNGEIERNNFVRAANLASSLGVEENRLKELHSRALWQMAAMNRNPIGTKILADRYGYSKDEIKQILEQCMDSEDNSKALKSRYDPSTSRYLSFNEWMDLLVKDWNRLDVA